MKHAMLAEMMDASIEEHAFSGVISIRRGEDVLYERASGYADRSNEVPNTMETRFGIASGTKFFTALAIGKLIEAGRLSFSTRLAECVALDFPRYSTGISIRHLLTHTSGVPDYFDEEEITDFDNFTLDIPWYELKGPRDYLAVFPDGEMKFAPGERFSYSNGGYILLGVVIEEVSGMRYRDFVEREIFHPVGMSRSGYFALNKLPENTATGYVEEEGGWRTNVYDLPVIGASDGGAFTTVGDLETMWDAFWKYEILPRNLVETYAAPHVKAETEGERTSYGHGMWIYEDEDGNREEYILGGDAGVSFKSSVSRGDGMRITVISNTTDGAWPVLEDIATALKDELRE